MDFGEEDGLELGGRGWAVGQGQGHGPGELAQGLPVPDQGALGLGHQ